MMSDTDKALNLLIHDLRAPLSVAQGYLRLLKEDRLPSSEDRTRAFEQTLDALGRMSRLCTEATAFVADDAPDRAAASPIPTPVLTAPICEAVRAAGVPATDDHEASFTVRVASVDTLAHAIGTIAAALRRERPAEVGITMHVDTADRELRFLLGEPIERARLAAGDASAQLDPWRGGHGLALPLACRAVVGAGGRIWTIAGTRGALGIALPLETAAV